MIQGIFNSNQGIVGERVGDFASAMLQINPTGEALLLALSSGMTRTGCQDTAFTWYEDVYQPGRQDVTTTGTGVTVGVADGSNYIPNMILLVEETGEHMFVSATNGNSLTVRRGFAGTTVVALTTSMHVQLIGNAHEEASNRPTAITQQGHPRSNVTQIFRNAWAVSGTATAVKFRTGNKVAQNRQHCAQYHAEDIERSFLWGRKHIETINGRPFRTSDGILTQISQYGGVVETANTGSTAGNLSRVDLEDFMRRIFAKNIKGQPNERIAFCGDIVLQVLNQMAMLDGTYYLKAEETKLGIKITTLLTPFGTLKLMTHPMMSVNPIWAHELYVLHPGGINKRILRDTFEQNYDQNGNKLNGVDADEGIVTTELGFECKAAQTMGIFRNIQKAVKSAA